MSTNILRINYLFMRRCIPAVFLFSLITLLSYGEIDTLEICAGQSVQLNVTTSGLFYKWDPLSGLSRDSIPDPTASPSQTTTYVATIWIPDTLGQLIVNPDFEAGNTGFSSDYIYEGNDLQMEGTYTVSNNPDPFHADGAWSACTDHTTGSGNMMIVNGDSSDYVKVWGETVNNIESGTIYVFSAWLENIWYSPSASPGKWTQLQFSINNTPFGELLVANTIDTCQWLQFYELWNSNSNTSAAISIVNRHLEPQGNDFALDDIMFAPLKTVKDTFVVIVHPYPVVDLGPDTVVAYGSGVTLDAGNAGATFSWSTGETSQTITLTNITEPVTVSVTVSSFGCESSDSKTIGVGCGEIIIPNVFAPGGSAPDNRLQVYGTGFGNVDFMIFNRFGEMVFRTHDPAEGWDGTYKGIDQPMDVYVYYFKADCLSGGPVEKKGNITLLR
jgi:gliding motility-associated-like protein